MRVRVRVQVQLVVWPGIFVFLPFLRVLAVCMRVSVIMLILQHMNNGQTYNKHFIFIILLISRWRRKEDLRMYLLVLSAVCMSMLGDISRLLASIGPHPTGLEQLQAIP